MRLVHHRYSVFQSHRRLASGPLADVALAVRRATEERPDEPVLVFDDATGAVMDLDTRGSDEELIARLADGVVASSAPPLAEPAADGPRGRGRPRLGVVAREVTLLPRHWEWLAAQPGGASVALRKLVDAARRESGDADRQRQDRDATYRFMSAIGGDLPHFEEAARALYADDLRRLGSLIADWPADVRDHAMALAVGAGDEAWNGDASTNSLGTP